MPTQCSVVGTKCLIKPPQHPILPSHLTFGINYFNAMPYCDMFMPYYINAVPCCVMGTPYYSITVLYCTTKISYFARTMPFMSLLCLVI